MRSSELTPIGETLVDVYRYEADGGVCPEPGCERVSGHVRLGHHEFDLPCREHEEEQERRRDAEELEHRVALAWTTSGVTDRLRPWSFETYREIADEPRLAALRVAEDWTRSYLAAGRAPNLMLFGQYGNGKTGLAWSIVRELVEHGVPAQMVNFRKLLDEMRDAFKAQMSIRKYLAAMLASPVLVLDDIGSEKPTKWTREQLLAFVDQRYERQLPTIFVSNYRPSELAKRLSEDDDVVGGRIVSRMVEGAVQHYCRGGNLRGQLAA